MQKIICLLMSILILNSVAPSMRQSCWDTPSDNERGIVYIHYSYIESGVQREKVAKITTGYAVSYVLREDLILEDFEKSILSNNYEIDFYRRYNYDEKITMPYILTSGDLVEYYKGVTDSFHIYVILVAKNN